MKIAFIRPPSTSSYADSHLRECCQITYFLGYCKALKRSFTYKVFDFTLDQEITINDVLKYKPDVAVISVRETGSNQYYGIRILNVLDKKIDRILLYGQVGRYEGHSLYSNIETVIHDENKLYGSLFGSSINSEISFVTEGFYPVPYFEKMLATKTRKDRFKAALETTRGCQFKCKFCFINNGENYPERWMIRPNEAILKDIDVYYKKGVRTFIFMDSEFLGTRRKHYDYRLELLLQVKKKYSNISYMIYCRADTLSRFPYLTELKDSGFSTVLIGVESLVDDELIALKKGNRSEAITKSIHILMENKIYMNLSYILFNRSTTILSLKENIEKIKGLYSSPFRQYLGAPNFIYNFEASLSGEGNQELSNKTYVRWGVHFKEQPNQSKVIFDTSLEPIMDVFRAIHYEVARKIAELNIETDSPSPVPEMIMHWYRGLGLFCIGLMERAINRFESGDLNLESISAELRQTHHYFSYYYKKTLPDELQNVLTAPETNKLYGDNEEVPYTSHGWDHRIPAEVE